jgi:ribosome-associated heat shock protein Hsp15
MTTTPSAEEGIRLDKWLWAARFFKTRQLATEAINGGKVHLDGQRTKPGRTVRPGTRLTVHKGALSWDICVIGISKQRRPAAEAAGLYEEDEASRLRRQELVRTRREQGTAAAPRGGRPSKRDRRLIHRFTRRTDET